MNMGDPRVLAPRVPLAAMCSSMLPRLQLHLDDSTSHKGMLVTANRMVNTCGIEGMLVVLVSKFITMTAMLTPFYYICRSSLSVRINSLAQVGGVNSLENFARSWSRAAGFAEIPPRKPSFVIEERRDDDLESSRTSDIQPSSGESRSLLRQQLEREGTSSAAVIDEASTPHQEDEEDEEATQRREVAKSTPDEAGDTLDQAPYLASPFASSYGGKYGSLSSRTNDSAMRHAGKLYHEQQVKGRQEPDKEQEPLLVQVIEQKDGRRVQVVVGQSTLPQTVFNSVNVLIGVGLLSLPLGLKYSGWLVGTIFLLLSAITTRYTAGVLAKCLDVNTSLIGFADIAYQAFGERARVATAFLFTIELLATCVALAVLFADTLDALIPGWGIIEWKLLCGVILIPLSFIPLRYLSVTSVLGIICSIGSKSVNRTKHKETLTMV